MRRGWQTWLLVVIVLAVFWILVVPNVDLDPVPPVNLESILFAVIAICILLNERQRQLQDLQLFGSNSIHLSSPTDKRVFAQVSPLRC